jgi:hypothetical protein
MDCVWIMVKVNLSSGGRPTHPPQSPAETTFFIQNAQKLTYSKVKFQKFSGGDPRTQLHGQSPREMVVEVEDRRDGGMGVRVGGQLVPERTGTTFRFFFYHRSLLH